MPPKAAQKTAASNGAGGGLITLPAVLDACRAWTDEELLQLQADPSPSPHHSMCQVCEQAWFYVWRVGSLRLEKRWRAAGALRWRRRESLLARRGAAGASMCPASGPVQCTQSTLPADPRRMRHPHRVLAPPNSWLPHRSTAFGKKNQRVISEWVETEVSASSDCSCFRWQIEKSTRAGRPVRPTPAGFARVTAVAAG